MIYFHLGIKVSEKRFFLEIERINMMLKSDQTVQDYEYYLGVRDLVERINFFLDLAPLEEWLTSEEESERNFALTWLVPSFLTRVKTCILEKKLIIVF